ncbi:MAG: PKD domain-containing protein [Phycisphaerae bacterium]
MGEDQPGQATGQGQNEGQGQGSEEEQGQPGGEGQPPADEPDPGDDPDPGDEEGDDEPENTAPLADAGDDQSVTGGDAVMLDGSGSSDPDGDDLAYAWMQIAGPDVTLTDDDTASPTFTAPDEDTTLTFELTADDGMGGSDTDTMDVIVTQATIPQLYITNLTGNSVTSYQYPASVNGNIAPDTNLQGVNTFLDVPADVVVNPANDLLVVNFSGLSITTYMDAPTTNGNLEPDGNVVGAATLLDFPASLAITPSDQLIVADFVANELHTFENTTQATFNGNLAPVRTVTSADFSAPSGINFGDDGDLYVANSGATNVLVFADAANLNGDFTATRIIESAAFTGVFDVFVDGDDNLFVVDPSGFIFTFNDASSLNGMQAPDFTLDVPGAGSLTAVAVDSDGTGYIVDRTNDAIYVYDNLANRNGAINPDRTIQGAQTQLDGPIRLYLAE